MNENHVMQGLNLIWIYNHTADKVLMCKRHKEPYKGMHNLVGGKIEPTENGLAAAYRELQEETGLSGIRLHHLMDFAYFMKDRCKGAILAAMKKSWFGLTQTKTFLT